jgi:beta-phosphoglucomutase-like phosphatase (HAD superfamily)
MKSNGKLGRYTFLSRSEVKRLYAQGKAKRNKGISMVDKIKSVLRKIFVNGKKMRKASVLKQNKYRKK